MINWAHVHLIINHFPVIGILGSILLFTYGFLKKNDDIIKAGFGAFVLIALMTLPVFFTGKAAVEAVKNLPGVTETVVGRHEEIASLALVMMEVLGAAALGGLFLHRRSGSFPKWLIAAVLALSLLTAAVVGLTANLGGQIRHTEIRGAE